MKLFLLYFTFFIAAMFFQTHLSAQPQNYPRLTINIPGPNPMPDPERTGLDTFELLVLGEGLFEEVVVLLEADWPDYVFEPNYDLMSLKDLEKYIQMEGHLPNLPDAAEIKEKGIKQGEMDAKLLEKIEELTLYTINLNKRIEQQQKIIDQLLDTSTDSSVAE